MTPLKPKNPPRSKVGWVVVLSYVVLRMAADPIYWRYQPIYAAYAFEAIFVLGSILALGAHKKLWRTPNAADLGTAALALAGGWGAYRLAAPLGIPIPFDLTSTETLILLLAVAPVLEEAIFRLALWDGLAAITKRSEVPLVGTTLLFAAGHFAAFPFVPEAYRGFVAYQTAYVLALGLAAGWRRQRSGAAFASVLVHFGFNLGFYLSS